MGPALPEWNETREAKEGERQGRDQGRGQGRIGNAVSAVVTRHAVEDRCEGFEQVQESEATVDQGEPREEESQIALGSDEKEHLECSQRKCERLIDREEKLRGDRGGEEVSDSVAEPIGSPERATAT